MSEQASQHKLLDLIDSNTSYDDFKQKVSELVANKSKLSLESVSDGLLAVAVFAPSPATFDREAMMYVLEIEEDQVTDFLSVATSLGVIIENEDGRLQISTQAAEALGSILDSME